MSVHGTIISFGKCAATIQTEEQQYYAPYRELNYYVMSSLLGQHHNVHKMEPVLVTFDIDTTRHSGVSNKKPRYYATSVQLREIVYL